MKKFPYNLQYKIDEMLTIIELSDTKIRDRFKQYGFYGYNVEENKLIRPMFRFEMILISNRVRLNSRLENRYDTVNLFWDNEIVVGIDLITPKSDDFRSLKRGLKRLFLDLNIVIISTPMHNVHIQYHHLKRSRSRNR